MNKKICRILCLILILLVPAALAEVDFEGASLTELYEIREKIDARIAELEAEIAATVRPSGKYVSGEDILPGVYVLIQIDGALIPNYTIRDVKTDETLEFEIITGRAVIALREGESLECAEATVYNLGSQPEVVEIIPGGYLVGGDIEPGEYVTNVAEDTLFACYSLYDSPSGSESKLTDFALAEDGGRIALEEGQYIVLSACSLTKI